MDSDFIFFCYFFHLFTFFCLLFFSSFFWLIKIPTNINKIRKRMGCLPLSAFFYVIKLDASTTVRVANMKERICHLSSSSSLGGIPWTSYKVANAPMRSLLIHCKLSSPTIKKDMHSFAHEWVLQTPFAETSGRDQHSSLVDCHPPQ